jgi:hypothetical protein
MCKGKVQRISRQIFHKTKAMKLIIENPNIEIKITEDSDAELDYFIDLFGKTKDGSWIGPLDCYGGIYDGHSFQDALNDLSKDYISQGFVSVEFGSAYISDEDEKDEMWAVEVFPFESKIKKYKD